MTVAAKLYSVPISARHHPLGWQRKLVAAAAGTVFNLGCVAVRLFEFVAFLVPASHLADFHRLISCISSSYFQFGFYLLNGPGNYTKRGFGIPKELLVVS